MSRFLRLAACLALASGLPAQVGFGTLLQSIDNTQLAGVTAVGLQGNPSITTNEVIAWSQGEANGRARALFNAQALGILFGDRNNDGLPFDWPDIDDFDVSAPQPGQNQPSPFDFRFSFATDVLNQTGAAVVTSGDIIQLTGIGTYNIVIPRGAFQAALGTSVPLNVDGYAELSDGAVLVSFKNPVPAATGNNIINPSSGQPGTPIPWNGGDVFIIRPPFGSLPAIFAYRKAELDQVVSFYYGSSVWDDVRAIEDQPPSPGINPTLITNPNDPTALYQIGRRPRLLWTINGDDNVFCWTNTLNPLSVNHNFYAIVGSGAASAAGYVTNGGSNRVFIDALAIWPQTMTTNTRLTLDVNSLTPAGGSSLTVAVRSPEAAGTRFQLALSTTLLTGTGVPIGTSGFRTLVLNYLDPLFLFSLDPLFAPIFLTGVTDAAGTATTNPIPIPLGISGVRIYIQGYETTAPNELTAPTIIRVM